MHNFEQVEQVTASVISGQMITSIDFVMDYVVVNFADGAINFYTWPVFKFGEEEYEYAGYTKNDVVSDFVGCVVNSLEITEEVFHLGLNDGRNIYCYLGSADREIPEEIEFGSKEVWWII